jgi:hypothetical protein
MAFPLTIYVIAISLRAMYEFLIIFGVIEIIITFILTVGHLKQDKPILLKIGKGLNVVMTFICFMNIFATDLAVPLN